ncbi:MAG: hypothetical protein CM15mV111_060 [uncultured marine virus]|nr:MAG: hypothetical protein CM15mV111_060 [uncultured marine virus]
MSWIAVKGSGILMTVDPLVALLELSLDGQPLQFQSSRSVFPDWNIWTELKRDWCKSKAMGWDADALK